MAFLFMFCDTYNFILTDSHALLLMLIISSYYLNMFLEVLMLVLFVSVITDQNGDCNDKFGNGSDWSFFELKDGEHFLEQVLWKIEMVHSRVHKLKGQIDIILSKNAARFSSSENLSLLAPCEGQTSSAHSPTCSAGNGETVSVGHVYSPPKHMSEFDNVDLVMPGSAILSYAEAFHVSDIIESTVGLLPAADVTLHEPQIGDSCEDVSLLRLPIILIHFIWSVYDYMRSDLLK